MGYSYSDLQHQLQALMSLGYTREDIMKIVITAPAIFTYTPEGIKSIFDSFNTELNFADNTQITQEKGKCKKRDLILKNKPSKQ